MAFLPPFEAALFICVSMRRGAYGLFTERSELSSVLKMLLRMTAKHGINNTSLVYSL